MAEAIHAETDVKRAEAHFTADIELEKVLNKLERTSRSLLFIGNSLLVSTLACLFSVLAAFYFIQRLQVVQYTSPIEQGLVLWAALAIFFFCLSIILLIVYDRLKRQGNVLFEEISDELQWWTVNKGTNFESDERNFGKQERPLLRTRILLREYTHITDLPLVRGLNGTLLYLLLNIGLLGSIAFVYYQMGQLLSD